MLKLIKELIKQIKIYIIQSVFITKTQKLKVNKKNTMIIAPHPDDETFGCGGLIAKKTKLKSNVYIVFLTNGENSLQDINKEEIIKNRKKSSINALSKLGISNKNIFWLNYVDGSIPRKDFNEFNQLIEKILEIINKYEIKELYVPHYLEGWSDHLAAYEVGIEILKNSNINLYLYFVWTLYYLKFKQLFNIKWKNLYLLNLKDIFPLKKEAMSIYFKSKSNNGKLYIGNLPKSFINIFNWRYEIFEKVNKNEI
ncbi:PIG-L family deacetylase [Caminibacter mediatlanticus TB-2]|uniref:PIG-L family deacetylase n=1 Tax=Caminibacter mediatlanticus TB-2 TaxID=391592 RepID=A0ABX5V6Q8_9BACT|nr:PIG-L family deacetylase [Caminibacter mediatlanticus]QCT93958.1 PIG-L family deacetylase [Caminibacter mediatlanticus TB-2]